MRLGGAISAGTATAMLAVLIVFRFEGFSRAVFAIHWLLATAFLGGSRVLFRALGELVTGDAEDGPRTIIYGAGGMVLRERSRRCFEAELR